MSSGGPLIYHDELLESCTGSTIRQGDDRFFTMTVQTKAADLLPQVSPDLDKQFMSINDALHHLKHNFLWVVDYFANASIPTCVSELDQTIAQELTTSAVNVLNQSNKFSYPVYHCIVEHVDGTSSCLFESCKVLKSIVRSLIICSGTKRQFSFRA